ncbi:probable endonuclease 4 isoform X1 [Pygocentrus nattereri]|uniref:Xylose isomerase-like TIM barrel domain-containing protein n=1 Tax=Pygocentrus nattereri TaxID=42514 RepID=A0A3B4DSF8_PYGNA|nr:probable endonuclease 4 isoform X1 [Pygocentrus nattereri]XP_017560980.1 probable endonuclease 4 isoform X1 [Pygocentrus nattereri]XP_037400226.1 probable endonuclease 4 isoform X1 [Pygocentrus nattereri]
MGPRRKGEKRRKAEENLTKVDEIADTSRAEKPSEGRINDVMRGKKGRTKGRKKFIGAHVSIAGGIWKAVEASVDIGGRSFGLFLGSQRCWQRPALDPDVAVKFQEACAQHGFDSAHILPHGSYLMNCGSPKEDVFARSQVMLVDELSRCSALGLTQFNLHPGASMGSSTEECIKRIAQAINHAHQQTPAIVTVLENMSGQGSTVGGQFNELKSIIDLVRDKTRVGVCLDTCHAFAAGYDISSTGGVKSMLEEFDQVVGLNYLRAVHLNDSKGKLGCHLDRHEDIGQGQIGISAFRDIVNEPRLDNIPLILETPGRPGFEYAEQIQLLYSLCED